MKHSSLRCRLFVVGTVLFLTFLAVSCGGEDSEPTHDGDVQNGGDVDSLNGENGDFDEEETIVDCSQCGLFEGVFCPDEWPDNQCLADHPFYEMAVSFSQISFLVEADPDQDCRFILKYHELPDDMQSDEMAEGDVAASVNGCDFNTLFFSGGIDGLSLPASYDPTGPTLSFFNMHDCCLTLSPESCTEDGDD